MFNFLKGIIVGIGGILPGLSGSVLLVIFGLYENTVEAFGTLFKKFKKNFLYLFPLVIGFGVGVLLFSNIVDYFLNNFEMYTRYLFLGLILGTIPIFLKEVKKRGFKNRYYLLTLGAFIVGFSLFTLNRNFFPAVLSPNFIQCIFVGLIVAASAIIPGIDSAVMLSAFGLYEVYVKSIASLDFAVLIPIGIGIAGGVLILAYFINKLLKKHYTLTFSLILGLFISIIPSVLNSSCALGINFKSLIACLLVVVGFLISFSLERIKK